MVEGVINRAKIAGGLTVMSGFMVINLTFKQKFSQRNSK
ncbi:hypothetical protein EJP617_30450 [Erwinia sp. Ejp617]|nr:hypothetical protein EJP617_30450 [Erwinia sp. Ejp617]